MTMRATGRATRAVLAYFFAWMLWVPAVVSGQELPEAPPEDEVASEGSSEAAVSIDAAPAPSPSATPPPARRDLRLWAHAPGNEGLALLVRPGRTREAWRLICELPCEVTPMPGAWDIAVRPRGAEHPLPVAGRTIELHADGSLELRYSSREWMRIIGGVALAVGLASVIALSLGVAVDQGIGDPGPFPGGLFNGLLGLFYGVGFAVGGVLTLAGLGMLCFTPIARVRWVP